MTKCWDSSTWFPWVHDAVTAECAARRNNEWILQQPEEVARRKDLMARLKQARSLGIFPVTSITLDKVIEAPTGEGFITVAIADGGDFYFSTKKHGGIAVRMSEQEYADLCHPSKVVVSAYDQLGGCGLSVTDSRNIHRYLTLPTGLIHFDD